MRYVKWPLLVLVCAGWIAAAPASPADTETGAYEVIFNASGFAVDIPGIPDASKHIREIHIDELNIDAREMTTGTDVEYRLYGPGHAHWGNATLTFDCGSRRMNHGTVKWFNEAAKGKDIRQDITVTLLKSDKSPGRTYTLVDAKPVDLVDCDDTSPDPVQILTVKPRRIEFGSRFEVPRPGKPTKDFLIDFVMPDGRVNPDDSWELVVGGARSHEEQPLLIGKVDFNDPTLDVVPHSTCTNLTLRGAMTDSRGALGAWITDTATGQPGKIGITIKEIKHDGTSGRSFTYHDSFPVRYVFPRMSVTNTTGNVMEEVRIKPVRCELKQMGSS